jgi:hypothetical protein
MAENENLAPQEVAPPDPRFSMYNKTIGSKLGESARRLLETYSNIPSDEVEKHVYTIVGFLSSQSEREN